MTFANKLEVAVLYVEDEALTRAAVSAPLGRRVQTLLQAENGKEGLELFRLHRPGIVITDIRMPVMDGLTMAREIKALDEKTQILVTTAHNDTNYFLNAIDIGIDRYVLKPIDHEKLFSGLEKCMATINLAREQQRHREECEKLIADLQSALATIKTLHGILPICSSCKKIRDDKGAWTQIEAYISEHTDAEFSHGICSDCAKKLYPDYFTRERNPSGE
ncbi:MAG: response regulator [Nitrospirae bacterium]|nr:response regulator [Nitrospirota bacterium]